ncbi:LGFP repeat-containing protein [Microbacterium sp. zg.Y909]|uniref:LGFP repeat-containing protein n=1 Tax=Microbacterium sp. zg.Y909 TaxID=2969413 RepID=UPI00214C0F56|nr:hypothetical protein [Microbacterium sp. zg.Y909]MCR2823998.1 hypothetical protein [Microbacterium sp. zg.Y909]
MTRPPAQDRATRSRAVSVILAALLVLVGGLVTTPVAAAVPVTAPTVVKTADLSQFQPGNIISDAVFYDPNTMTEAQIQSFLNGKVPTCRSGHVCLKSKTDTTRSIPADAMCNAYQGGGVESSARIIFKVAQACGINPQVLLVMLEKEQSLVTDTWPYDSQYRIAMGQGCPDTAGCDSRYFGFFNQVHGAAWQLKRYANPPGTSNYFTWYAPGNTWNVRYHPNVSCGSSPVYIANKATAALYYYTPYQPNAASLRAGSGEGDACSSYGNRNFYRFFTDWFGNPVYRVEGAIATYWSAQGGATGWVGEPTAAMRSWPSRGWSQRFTGADLYFAIDGTQVYPTIGGTRDEYRLVGEAASGLGWPDGAVYAAGGGWYQDFRGGRIYVRPGDGRAFAVASPINEVYEAAGNIGGTLGWPSNRAYRYQDGSRQDFAGGSIFQGPTATVALDATLTAAYVASGGPSALGWPVSVGSTAAGQHIVLTKGLLLRSGSTTVTVRGAVFDAYAAAGGITGALGAPTGAEKSEGTARVQTFQNGTIYSTSAGAYAVTGLGAALAANGGTAALGYPTGPQRGAGPSYSQDFGRTTLTTGPAGAFTVAGAIGNAYRAMGGAASYLGAAKGPEMAVNGGFVQEFEGGRIVCSTRATVAVPSAVAAAHDAAGGPTGRLGWPTTAAAATLAGGWKQSYVGGDIFVAPDGRTAAAVFGVTLRTYLNGGGPAVLGFPTGPEAESAAGWSQPFQKSMVFVPRGAPASAVSGAAYDTFVSAGGVGTLGFALGPVSRTGGGVAFQPFAQATMYITPSGAFFTMGYIRTFYNSLGASGGVLGVPTGNEYATAGGFRQNFAGGSVLVSGTGAFVVRGALGAEYLRRGGETGPLGWPMGNETSGPGFWQQRFQNGTLVLRADGTYEVR